MQADTVKFLKAHQDIVVIRSDKGNKTVIMDRQSYREKALQHLEDPNVYQKVNGNGHKLTRLIEIRNNKLIDRMMADGSIEASQARALKSDGGIPPRIYMTIKTHKPNTPVRPVISTPGSPTYKLTAFIQETLITVPIDTTLNVKNSLELKEDIQSMNLGPDDVLVSFDVVSLYTNVPQNEAILAAMKRWGKMDTKQDLKKP